MKRRTAREKALQALFQNDVSNVEPKDAIEHVLEGGPTDEYLETLVFGTLEHQTAIDDLMKQHLEKWSIDRLANVDRNILRLAVYEFNYVDDVPVNVAMNEAIEIAKIYGDEQSSRFINAVLSKIKATL